MNTFDKINDLINNHRGAYPGYFYDANNNIMYVRSLNRWISEKNPNYLSFKKYTESKSTDYRGYYNQLTSSSITPPDHRQTYYKFDPHITVVGFIFSNRGDHYYMPIQLDLFNKSDKLTMRDPETYKSRYYWYLTYNYRSEILYTGFIGYNNKTIISYNFGKFLLDRMYIVFFGLQFPSPIFQYEYNGNIYNIVVNKDLRSKSGIFSLFLDTDTNPYNIYYTHNSDHLLANIDYGYYDYFSREYQLRYCDAILDVQDNFIYFLNINYSNEVSKREEANKTFLYKIDISDRSYTFSEFNTSELIQINDGESIVRSLFGITQKVEELSTTLDTRLLFFFVDDGTHKYLRTATVSIDYDNSSIQVQGIPLSDQIILDEFQTPDNQTSTRYISILYTNYKNGIVTLDVYIPTAKNYYRYIFELNEDQSKVMLLDSVQLPKTIAFPTIYEDSNKRLIYIDYDVIYRLDVDYENKKIIADQVSYQSYNKNEIKPAATFINNGYILHYSSGKYIHITPQHIDFIDYKVEIEWEQEEYPVTQTPFNVSGTLYVKDSQGNNINSSVTLVVEGGYINYNQTEIETEVPETGKFLTFTVDNPDLFKIYSYVSTNN